MNQGGLVHTDHPDFTSAADELDRIAAQLDALDVRLRLYGTRLEQARAELVSVGETLRSDAAECPACHRSDCVGRPLCA